MSASWAPHTPPLRLVAGRQYIIQIKMTVQLNEDGKEPIWHRLLWLFTLLCSSMARPGLPSLRVGASCEHNPPTPCPTLLPCAQPPRPISHAPPPPAPAPQAPADPQPLGPAALAALMEQQKQGGMGGGGGAPPPGGGYAPQPPQPPMPPMPPQYPGMGPASGGGGANWP